MNLSWHIIKKDLRRLWLPLGFWGLSVITSVIGDAARLSLDTNSLWGSTLTSLGGLSTFVGWVLVVVLAAMVVLNDPLKNATAFWMTRPISPYRLLVAKAWSLGLLIFLPVATQLAVQAGYGANSREVLLAAGEASLSRAVVILGTAAIATLVEELGSFFVRALALIFTTGFVGLVASSMLRASSYLGGNFAPPADSLALSAVLAAKFFALGLSVGFLWWRYLSRPTGWATVWLYLGALVVVLTPLLWSWDFFQPKHMDSSLSVNGSTFTLEASELQTRSSSTNMLYYTGKIAPVLLPTGEMAVPQGVRNVELQGGNGRKQKVSPSIAPGRGNRSSVATYSPAALQRCLAPLQLKNPPNPGTLTVELGYLNSEKAARVGREHLRISANVDASRCRYEIEAEVPAVLGGGTRVGQSAFLVEQIAVADGKVECRLREQEYRSALIGDTSNSKRRTASMLLDSVVPDFHSQQNVFYILANRGRGEALLGEGPPFDKRASVGEFSVNRRLVKFNSGHSGLVVDAPWLRDATLLRVRLVELGPLECPLSAVEVMLKN